MCFQKNNPDPFDSVTKHGIRVTNLEGCDVKLPADETLSNDIKALGYWCAWSDHYYVRNLGHEVTEFETNIEYYRANYAIKGVGVDGWKARLDTFYALPKFKRESATFPDRHIVVEKTDIPVQGKAARLWSMFDTRTPEVETLDFIYGLVRLVKPAAVFESNTWLGLTTCAVAKGLNANGFGKITTLESDVDVYTTATKNISAYGLAATVNAFHDNEIWITEDQKFDLAIFNAPADEQIQRFLQFRDYLADGSVVIFCNAAGHFPITAEGILSLQAQKIIQGLELPTPRGLFIGRIFVAN